MFQEIREQSVTKRYGLGHSKSITASLNDSGSITGIIESNDALELCIDNIFDNNELINNTNDVHAENAIDDEAIKEPKKNRNRISRGKLNVFLVLFLDMQTMN